MENLSTRQYVGARYVPKLMGEWDKKISYENLVIVTYKGNSFTSKQPVPQGIEISDTNYWINTGNYNAQIEEYREELKTTKTDIDNEINVLENNINKLETSLKNKNIVCIGDSYLAYSSQEMETESWGAFLRNYLGKDNKVTLNGLGGSGFVGNASKNFGDLLTEVYNNMTEEERNDITDVIVCGGLNDASAIADNKTTVDSIISKMREFFTSSSNYFPNANIRVGAIGWMNTGFENRDKYITQFISIVELYRKAPFYSSTGKVSYLNGVEYIMPVAPSNYYKNDLIHPKATASSSIGLGIYQALKTGSYNTIRSYNAITLKPTGECTAINNNTVKIFANSNTINIVGGSFGVNLSINTIAQLRDYTIATCSPIRATSNTPLIIPVTVAIFPGKNSTYDVVNGQLKFTNGNVSLYLIYNANITNYTNITSLSVFVPNLTSDILISC